MRALTIILLLTVGLEASQVRNVLFLVSDDLKASVLGCYGDQFCKTPNIDRLAARGMVFERAYCQGTTCGPSRQSFMFSRYKGKTGPSMAQHFKDNGYYSARVGKIYHMRVPGDIIAGTNGVDHAPSWTERFNSQGLEAHTPGKYACLSQNRFTRSPHNRESTKMRERMFVTVESDGDGSGQPDHKTASKTIHLLRQHKDEGKGFFIAAGFVRPHYPMVAPKPYFANYPWKDMPLPLVPDGDLDDIPRAGIAGNRNATSGIGKHTDNQKRMWAGYYASVEFMDTQVGRILEELDRLSLYDSTAIVFTSDHGYHLGEHTFWEKGNLREEVTRVPVILAAPGIKPGRSRSIIELVDLYPTLASLAGLSIPNTVQGSLLQPIIENPQTSVKPGALSFVGRGTSLRTPGWHYARYKDESEELYDMQADPHQYRNLAKSTEHAGQLTQLRKRLRARSQAIPNN